jgi:multicomponent Na+:H+ antiporter subunit B
MSFSPFVVLDIGLMAMLVVVAFAVVRMRSLFAIVMLQGVYSLLSAAWFVSLDAVDVAFTEAAVGAGISTVLMLGAMLLTDRDTKLIPVKQKVGPLLIVIVTGLALFYAIGDMPAFGDANSPANSYIGAEYVDATRREIFLPNVVTAVLASYRGYDTFGETVVIFMAGLGVLLLLGLNGNAGMWRATPNGVDVSAKKQIPAVRKKAPKKTPKSPAKNPTKTATKKRMSTAKTKPERKGKTS